MADRVSTIRYRVEGTQDVQSRIQELDKAFARQQRQTEQSVRDARKAVAGGFPGSGELVKIAQQDADQLARLAKARRVEQNIQFQQERINAADKLKQTRAAEQAVVQTEGKMQSQAMAMEEKRFAKVAAGWQKQDALEKKAEKNYALAQSQAIEMDRERTVKKQAAIQAEGRMQAAAIAEDKKRSGVGDDAATNTGTRRMGGAFVLGRAIGSTLGDVMKDPQIGKAFSTISEGFLLGGGVMGGISTGLELVSSVFLAVRESALRARQAMSAYGESVSEASQRSAQFAIVLGTSNSFGKELTKEADSSLKAAAKLGDAYRKEVAEESYVTKYFDLHREEKQTEQAQIGFEFDRAMALRREAARQRPVAQAAEWRGYQLRSTAMAASEGPPSLSKKRSALNAEIAADRDALNTKHDMENRQAQWSVDRTKKEYDTLSERLEIARRFHETATVDELAPKEDAARRAYEDAVAARKSMPGPHLIESSEEGDKARHKRAALDEEDRKENLRLEDETQDARINSIYVGLEKEDQLRKAHQASRRAEMRLDYGSANPQEVARIQNVNALEVAEDQEAAQRRVLSLQQYGIDAKNQELELAVHVRDMTQEQADLERMKAEAVHAGLKGPDVDKAIAEDVAAREKTRRKSEAFDIDQQMLAAGASIMHLQGKLTRQEEHLAALKRQFPRADEGQLARLSRRDEQLYEMEHPMRRGEASTNYGFGDFNRMSMFIPPATKDAPLLSIQEVLTKIHTFITTAPFMH